MPTTLYAPTVALRQRKLTVNHDFVVACLFAAVPIVLFGLAALVFGVDPILAYAAAGIG